MNKFITTDTGGLPYKLDDIRWEMDAYREAIGDLSRLGVYDGSGSGILWGCVVTDNTTTYDITAGAIFSGGEVYHVASATGLTKVAAQALVLRISTGTYDSAGLKTFQDTVSHNTYEKRYASALMAIPAGGDITLTTTGTSSIPLKADLYLLNKLAPVKTTLGDTAISNSGSIVAGFGLESGVEVKFWKQANHVYIQGGFTEATPTSKTTRVQVGTLPTSYRPPHSVMINGYAANQASATTEWCVWEIDTSGQIWIRGDIHNAIHAVGVTFNATTGVKINGSFTV